MNEQEVAFKFYDAARAELLERIRLRENILLLYMSAVATLLGISFGKQQLTLEILFVIPLLSFSVAILVSHHNSLIGSLGVYCSTELKKNLNLNLSSPVVQWDESKSLLDNSRKAIRSRYIPHLLIICVPAIIALALNQSHSVPIDSWESAIWWLCCLFTLLSFITIKKSGSDRKDNFHQIESQSR